MSDPTPPLDQQRPILRHRRLDTHVNFVPAGRAAALLSPASPPLSQIATMATIRTNLNIKQLPMRYNKLGDSGLLVSELSFGCMM